mgnify:CR=1 FL=1
MRCNFLEKFNSIDIRSVQAEEDWDFQVYFAVAGGGGFSLYWQRHWCAEEWPEHWKNGGRALPCLNFSH